jgi:hypothetical protein
MVFALRWARMGAKRSGVCSSSCSGGGGGNDRPYALTGRRWGTGEDAPVWMGWGGGRAGVDGVGGRRAEGGVQLGPGAGAEGLIYPPPPTALAETRRIEDEDVSERTDGERVYVERAGASPPGSRSAQGISIGREPLAFPLPLISTLPDSWRSLPCSLTTPSALNRHKFPSLSPPPRPSRAPP